MSEARTNPNIPPTSELFFTQYSIILLYHLFYPMSSLLDKKSDREDEALDSALRPKKWADYVGQEKIKENIRIIITAAKQRNQTPDHLLFYGNSGLGKTTLAQLVAMEMGKEIRITSGPAIERAGDLAAILTNLNEGDVLFLDEIHRISKTIEEYLYPAMEDYKLNLILGKGPMARTMELKQPKFTLIGATTRPGFLSAPLRNRFGATFQLNFYTKEDVEKIIKRSAEILGIQIDQPAIKIIAERSRFTPRVANRLLKRVRDFAQVESNGKITKKISEHALDFLEVDQMGLEPGDRNILFALINKFNGGPVGLQTLAAAAMEEEDTILDLYEPYLMQMGFLERTPRGRIASRLAYEHLNLLHLRKQLI
jgi:Holliday junction DNA helicase RuvB